MSTLLNKFSLNSLTELEDGNRPEIPEITISGSQCFILLEFIFKCQLFSIFQPKDEGEEGRSRVKGELFAVKIAKNKGLSVTCKKEFSFDHTGNVISLIVNLNMFDGITKGFTV